MDKKLPNFNIHYKQTKQYKKAQLTNRLKPKVVLLKKDNQKKKLVFSKNMNLKSLIGSQELNDLISRQKTSIINNGLYLKEKISFTNEKNQEVLKMILQKNKKFRNELELKYLRKFFSDFKLLQMMEKTFASHIMVTIIKELQYLHKNENEQLYTPGNNENKFYIIIDGEVEIREQENLVNTKSSTPEQKTKKAQLTEKTHQCSSKGQISEQLIPEFLRFNTQSSEEHIHTKYDPLRLYQGELFGEIALKHGVTSEAKVRCVKESHFAVLSNNSYQKILKLYHNDEILKFRRFDHFKTIPLEILQGLFKKMTKLELPENHIIYKEDDASEDLYFITQGKIMLDKRNKLEQFKEKLGKIGSKMFFQQKLLFKNANKRKLRNSLSNVCDLKLKTTTLSEGESFGGWNETAKVVSGTCILYKMPYVEFNKVFREHLLAKTKIHPSKILQLARVNSKVESVLSKAKKFKGLGKLNKKLKFKSVRKSQQFKADKKTPEFNFNLRKSEIFKKTALKTLKKKVMFLKSNRLSAIFYPKGQQSTRNLNLERPHIKEFLTEQKQPEQIELRQSLKIPRRKRLRKKKEFKLKNGRRYSAYFGPQQPQQKVSLLQKQQQQTETFEDEEEKLIAEILRKKFVKDNYQKNVQKASASKKSITDLLKKWEQKPSQTPTQATNQLPAQQCEKDSQPLTYKSVRKNNLINNAKKIINQSDKSTTSNNSSYKKEKVQPIKIVYEAFNKRTSLPYHYSKTKSLSSRRVIDKKKLIAKVPENKQYIKISKSLRNKSIETLPYSIFKTGVVQRKQRQRLSLPFDYSKGQINPRRQSMQLSHFLK